MKIRCKRHQVVRVANEDIQLAVYIFFTLFMKFSKESVLLDDNVDKLE